MITIIQTFGAFSDIFLAPKGLLADHVVCLTLLLMISAIFALGSLGLSYVDDLDKILGMYHVQFLISRKV